MNSPKTYEVCFVRSDGTPDEIYCYTSKTSAMEHFRLFYCQDSSELYLKIYVCEYNWDQKSSCLLGLLTFIENNYLGKPIKKDWRNWSVGRPTIWEFHDFDGYGIHKGIITEKDQDHAIMESDGMKLWIDDDSIYMFR